MGKAWRSVLGIVAGLAALAVLIFAAMRQGAGGLVRKVARRAGGELSDALERAEDDHDDAERLAQAELEVEVAKIRKSGAADAARGDPNDAMDLFRAGPDAEPDGREAPDDSARRP